jgi:nicotinate-nucleotide--dimethylbenzimidazole phosphoribosyltransferase
MSLSFRSDIAPPDRAAMEAARERIDHLTKPAGSLGRLEELAVQLAGIAGGLPAHRYERRTILIAAGDHGCTEDGVSAYPSDVTAQMIGAFLGGFAAINALAATSRAQVLVANFGVRAPLEAHPKLIDVLCGYGTANLARRAAIPRAELDYVLAAGVAAFDEAMEKAPFDVLAIGEMGIGNTTSAAAIVCGLTAASPGDIAGRGTGIDDDRLANKIRVIERGLARCEDHTWDEIASEVGGYEIVGLAGVILAAARARIPVVLDGFIVAAAALVAAGIAPRAIDYCIASHRSQERGHAHALAALGLRPLFDLELRLGEGSGAALALPIVESAARMMCDMKTFAEAGVATKEEEVPQSAAP